MYKNRSVCYGRKKLICSSIFSEISQPKDGRWWGRWNVFEKGVTKDWDIESNLDTKGQHLHHHVKSKRQRYNTYIVPQAATAAAVALYVTG